MSVQGTCQRCGKQAPLTTIETKEGTQQSQLCAECVEIAVHGVWRVKPLDDQTIASRHATFRWDSVAHELLVTTKSEQIHLTADKVMELLETLYTHRDDIIESARALPEWARDPNPASYLALVALVDDEATAGASEPGIPTHDTLTALIARELGMSEDHVTLDSDTDAFLVDGDFLCYNDDIGADELESVRFYTKMFLQERGKTTS